MTNPYSEPLLKSSEKGDTENVKFLISKGTEVNFADNNGSTPLIYAAMNGFTDTARALRLILQITMAQHLLYMLQ